MTPKEREAFEAMFRSLLWYIAGEMAREPLGRTPYQEWGYRQSLAALRLAEKVKAADQGRGHCEDLANHCIRYERVRLATPQDADSLVGHECLCRCYGCLAAREP